MSKPTFFLTTQLSPDSQNLQAVLTIPAGYKVLADSVRISLDDPDVSVKDIQFACTFFDFVVSKKSHRVYIQSLEISLELSSVVKQTQPLHISGISFDTKDNPKPFHVSTPLIVAHQRIDTKVSSTHDTQIVVMSTRTPHVVKHPPTPSIFDYVGVGLLSLLLILGAINLLSYARRDENRIRVVICIIAAGLCAVVVIPMVTYLLLLHNGMLVWLIGCL